MLGKTRIMTAAVSALSFSLLAVLVLMMSNQGLEKNQVKYNFQTDKVIKVHQTSDMCACPRATARIISLPCL